MELNKALETLGFSAKEIQVYLTVLKLGKTTPAEVAKITKIGRPTVYNIAKSLLTKGVIAEDKADSVLHLVALPPEGLKASLEQTRVELAKREEIIEETIEQLAVMRSEDTYPVPKLRFIEEGELRDHLFQNAVKWNESTLGKDGVWYGFQDHSFVENYADWIDWTVRKFKDTDYKVRLFSNASKIEERLEGKIPTRTIKFLKDSRFTATTWVVGDYLVMISSRKSPFYLVEIHDALMAENMREVFKNMWAVSE
ncbi:MAG: helix-turn-helix domain-containing protein [Patescibacteria group bacterium]